MKKVNTGNEKEKTKIREDVRQSCGLSQQLFNVYLEDALNMFRERNLQEIKVWGEKIDILMYADDIMMMAEI